MRFIKKSDSIPECIIEHIEECKKLGIQPPYLYKDFNHTGELREILISEQNSICCYCQRPVAGYRIEHLYPENGPDEALSKSKQLDYYNLYASCIDSQGLPPHLQYCDVAKANKIIRPFIQEENCIEFFRYNIRGEIIPNGSYWTWDEYINNEHEDGDIIDAVGCIKTLNLNCTTLVEKRRKCIDNLIKILSVKPKVEVEAMIDNWCISKKYPDFVDLCIQFIKHKYPDLEAKII